MIYYIDKKYPYKDNSNIVLVGIEHKYVIYKEEHKTKEHKAKIKYSKRDYRAYFDTKIDGRHYIDNFVNCYGIKI